MTRHWLLATVFMVSLVGVGHAFAQLPRSSPARCFSAILSESTQKFRRMESIWPIALPISRTFAARDRTVGQQDDKELTAEKKRGIPCDVWPYDGEHLAYGQDADGDENWHLYTVNLKSGIVRDLTPFQGIQARFVAADPDFPNDCSSR